MNKRKILLASIVTAAALSMVGCSGSGGGSSVAGASADDSVVDNTPSSSTDAYFNTETDLRIDGVPYYEARSDATGDVPPNPPVIRR